MKKISILAGIIVLMSFSNKPPNNFDEGYLKKNFAKVKPDLFVCKYEVTNLNYRHFLRYLILGNQTELVNQYLPDTLVWRDATSYNEPLVRYYFRHEAYNNYPVVGITHDAAVAYCNWLTGIYNEDDSRKFKKVLFRLLSKEEWEFAANSGDTAKVYTWGSGFIKNNRKQFLCNYRHSSLVYDSIYKKYKEIPGDIYDPLSQVTSITSAVKSFYPSSSGIYNMCGNVAEMINEKGIAKGGSYNDRANDVRIASEKKYSKPMSDVGFRIGMEIIEH